MAEPATIHPAAWWLWALGISVAVTRTTNPLLLVLMMTVVVVTVITRGKRRDLTMYLWLAGVIIVIRLLFRVVLGGDATGTILFELASLPLPDWMNGVTIGGPVTVESLQAVLSEGLRLAAIVITFGAANSITDVRRLLALTPGALYEAGTAVSIGLTLAPRLIETAQQVNRAQNLRGIRMRGPSRLRRVVVPVLAGALHGSVTMASSMDARGYGRIAGVLPGRRHTVSALLLLGVVGVLIGFYGLLDLTANLPGAALVVIGSVLAVVGVKLGAPSVGRTRYRPDAWNSRAILVASSGIAAALLMSIGAVGDPSGFHTTPGIWPQLPGLGIATLMLAYLAILFSRESQ